MATLTGPPVRERQPNDPYRAKLEDDAARMLGMAAERRRQMERLVSLIEEIRRKREIEATALEMEARRIGRQAQSLARTRTNEEAATESKSAAAD